LSILDLLKKSTVNGNGSAPALVPGGPRNPADDAG
jgi:hypothetical protein